MNIDLKNNKNIVLGVAIFVAFALLVFSATSYLNYEMSQRFASRISPPIDNHSSFESTGNMTDIQNFIQERRRAEFFPGFFAIPIAALIGLLVGVIIYHILSGKIQKQEASLKKNSKIILNFLKPEERKVIEVLLENKGSIAQYELTRLPNLSKVKTHRIIYNLEEKGIVKKEKYGKINKITLNKELYDVLTD